MIENNSNQAFCLGEASEKLMIIMIRLDVDDYAERLALRIIDEILVIEGYFPLTKNELKFVQLELYISGAKNINHIILGDRDKIPILDTIIDIYNNVDKKYITEEKGWEKIRELIKDTGQLTKKYDHKKDIDIDNMKNAISRHIAETIWDICYRGEIKTAEDEKSELSRYITFEGILRGISDVYSSLLESLNLEIGNEIPLLESIKHIKQARKDKKISREEYWKQIRIAIRY